MATKKTTEKIPDYLKYPEIPFKVNITDKSDNERVTLEFVFANDSDDPVVISLPFFSAGNGEIVQTSKKWYIGLGKADELDETALGAAFMKAFSKAVFSLEEFQIKLPAALYKVIRADKTANLLFTALGVSAYPVDLLKKEGRIKKLKVKSVNLLSIKKTTEIFNTAKKRILPQVAHINGMRQVQSLPGNYMTAVMMQKRAEDIAAKYPITLKSFGQKELEKIGAGGILAVNRGSVEEPRMLVLDYNPKGAKKTLALVGKGVTFDTGGISIKPSSDMHEMKYDMSGAAAVVHSIAAIAEQKLPVRVICLAGMVENMPDGAAIKPGDVYTSLKGHTIEVQNTDAEGRLVLGDLLAYAEKEYKPDYMVNLATLTGAILVALASYYAGVFTEDNEIAALIEKAGADSTEPVWRMPLNRLFRDMLKSDIADYNNIGQRWGGSSSAAAFLSLFVENSKWAHLDIAGVGFIKEDHGVYPKVASGYGIRLLTELAAKIAAEK